MIEPGIYPNLSNEYYHADSAISRSKLMDFDKSPFYYWAMHINPDQPERESTKAMDIGQAYHDMILQPNLFAGTYHILPPKVLLKNVGRTLYETYKNTISDLESREVPILKHEEFEKLKAMNTALLMNPDARDLITGGVNEQSHFWKDKVTGLMLKCRPDIAHGNMIVDFKTCYDASPRAFQRAIIDYGYHVQAAIIQDGIKETEGRFIENFLYVCQEKEYPYMSGIYILDEAAIEAGTKKYCDLKNRLFHAINTNEWPGYGVQSISLPGWALNV